MRRAIIFGKIPGIEEGHWFAGRKEMMLTSFHRNWAAGIDGNGTEGTAAIVLSGGYEDDFDSGNVIIYTGAGGNNPNTGKQIEDQTWNNQGNAGLLKSMYEGLPVRVIRGFSHKSDFSPKSGYTYAGLYKVVDAWEEKGKNGYKICRFKLEYCVEPTNSKSPEEIENVYTTNENRRKEVTNGRYVENIDIRRLGRHCEGYGNTDNVLLPQDKNIDTKILAQIFNNTTATYKFYWFASILDLLVKEGKTVMSFREIVVGMIAEAWYPIHYFRLSFGKFDSLFKQLIELQQILNIPINSSKSHIRRSIIDNFENRKVKEQLRTLNLNVPYRFLLPWIKYTSDPFVVSESRRFANNCLYTINGERIEINPSWVGYLTENYVILKEFTFWNLTLFLQKFNPNVPDLSSKLAKSIKVESTNEKSLSLIISNLTIEQREIINSYIEFHYNNLSIRNQNAIFNFLDFDLSINNFDEKVFRNERFNVKHIKNVGEKSYVELNYFIKKISQFVEKIYIQNNDDDAIGRILNFENDDYIKKSSISSIISNLTIEQKEIINSYIEFHYNNLSIRNQNAIFNFLDFDLSINNFDEKIFKNVRFNVKHIKNVGEKSCVELNNFIKEISQFVEKIFVQKNDDDSIGRILNFENEDQLVILKNKYFFENEFSLSDIPYEILRSRSIFIMIDYLLVSNVLFDKYENIIFKTGFKIFNNQRNLSIEDIATELHLSRERVRQLKNRCLDNLYNKFLFVKYLSDDLFIKFDINQNQDLIFVDSELANRINISNKTNFSQSFISYLLYVYSSENYELVGNIHDVLQYQLSKSRNHHNWNNIYLVRRGFLKNFNFNQFVDDIEQKQKDRIDASYCLNFNSYIANFLFTEDIDMLLKIVPIAETIVKQEFEIIINDSEDIVFKKNTKKQVSEYVIEILEKLGKPSSIDVIYNIIKRDYPKITKSKDALRGSINRTTDIICFGRSSTYGLKKWEEERTNIKGGSIKSIVFDYLQDKTDPIHIEEILNELNRYRERINARNVISNLKLDPDKQFIFFNQGFIGLKEKVYNSNLTTLPRLLGKTIISYIKKHTNVDFSLFVKALSLLLEISEKNTEYIVMHLIKNKSLYMNIDNELYVL